MHLCRTNYDNWYFINFVRFLTIAIYLACAAAAAHTYTHQNVIRHESLLCYVPEYPTPFTIIKNHLIITEIFHRSTDVKELNYKNEFHFRNCVCDVYAYVHGEFTAESMLLFFSSFFSFVVFDSLLNCSPNSRKTIFHWT